MSSATSLLGARFWPSFFSQIRDIGLPILVLGAILALYAIVITTTWWRTFRYPVITELEFFCHLLVDILFFTALLFFSGGASNPFISYYLVPISIAATTLPLRYTWAITILSLAAYSWLLNFTCPFLPWRRAIITTASAICIFLACGLTLRSALG